MQSRLKAAGAVQYFLDTCSHGGIGYASALGRPPSLRMRSPNSPPVIRPAMRSMCHNHTIHQFLHQILTLHEVVTILPSNYSLPPPHHSLNHTHACTDGRLLTQPVPNQVEVLRDGTTVFDGRRQGESEIALRSSRATPITFTNDRTRRDVTPDSVGAVVRR